MSYFSPYITLDDDGILKIYRIRRICEGGNDYFDALGVKSVFRLLDRKRVVRPQKCIAAIKAVEEEIAHAKTEPVPGDRHLMTHYQAVLDQLNQYMKDGKG